MFQVHPAAANRVESRRHNDPQGAPVWRAVQRVPDHLDFKNEANDMATDAAAA
jgi:hypothetical protein